MKYRQTLPLEGQTVKIHTFIGINGVFRVQAHVDDVLLLEDVDGAIYSRDIISIVDPILRPTING